MYIIKVEAMKKRSRKLNIKGKYLILIVLAIVALLAIVMLPSAFKTKTYNKNNIKSFEDCEKAGGEMLLSNPAMCLIYNKSFTGPTD